MWVDDFDICRWCACKQRFTVEILMKTNDLGIFWLYTQKVNFGGYGVNSDFFCRVAGGW